MPVGKRVVYRGSNCPFCIVLVLIAPTLVAQERASAQTFHVSFEDASQLLDFEHVAVPAGTIASAGAAWFDYNKDGLLDLYLTNGRGQGGGLFRNNGNNTFSNVAAQAGIESYVGNIGVVAGDIDNDGYTDVFLTGDRHLTGDAESASRLYHNSGDGTFTEITSRTGTVGPETGASAAFADIDNDGFLDLFVTAAGSYTTRTQDFNRLYRNNGNLTFTDISVAAGVDAMLGACAAFFSDYNDDGWIDLFVANCSNVNLFPTPIQLFHNNGDSTFTDRTVEAGLAPRGLWMGFGPAEYDNDGDMDIFVTNTATSAPRRLYHALYENNCDGTFSNVAQSASAAIFEFGWGCTSPDLNNDGFADLFFAGSFPARPFPMIGPGLGNPGTLLLNNQDGTFTDSSSTLPVDLSRLYTSGVAAGDYDNDGFVDIVVGVEAYDDGPGRPVLLHNSGNENHWLTVCLQGTMSNRDAVGARVAVTAGDLTQVKQVYAGSSFLSMDSQWLTFGLSTHVTTERILVRWPLGLVERFPNVAADQTIQLIEGQGAVSSDPVGATCNERLSPPTLACGLGVFAVAPVIMLGTRRLRFLTNSSGR